MPSRSTHLTVVREVDRGQLDRLAFDVVPDVQLGPVRQREDPDALAWVDAARCTGPTARGAGSWGPTGRSRPGRSRCAPWPAPCPRRAGPRRRSPCSRPSRARRAAPASGSGCGCRPAARAPGPSRSPSCTLATTSCTPSFGHPPVAEVEHLREVVAGVDVHDRERDPAGPERLLGEAQHADRVLAAGEEQHRLLELGDDLAEDEDRLSLESGELAELVGGVAHAKSPFVERGDGDDRTLAIASRMRSARSGRHTTRSGRLGFGWL